MHTSLMPGTSTFDRMSEKGVGVKKKFGEVQVSLFVAGAVFGEIWNDSRSAKCCIFQYKMLVVGVKGNLGCEAGCGLTVSCTDHGRIILGSCSDRPRIGNDVSSVFSKFL